MKKPICIRIVLTCVLYAHDILTFHSYSRCVRVDAMWIEYLKRSVESQFVRTEHCKLIHRYWKWRREEGIITFKQGTNLRENPRGKNKWAKEEKKVGIKDEEISFNPKFTSATGKWDGFITFDAWPRPIERINGQSPIDIRAQAQPNRALAFKKSVHALTRHRKKVNEKTLNHPFVKRNDHTRNVKSWTTDIDVTYYRTRLPS